MVDADDAQASLRDYELRFRRAGLPLLIEDYSASEDVFNRAVPFLTVIFLIEVLGSGNLDWSPAANAAATAGGLALVLAWIGIVNRRRGRRFFAVPREVGRWELTTFVVVPSLLPLIFGGQVVSAINTAIANLVLLGVVYLVVGFGMFSILRWAAGRMVTQLASSLVLLVRAVPLLLIFALVLFINTELWQVYATVPGAFLALITAIFVALGTLFLAVRLPREVRALERDAGAGGPPLSFRQRLNVGLVMFVSQALQIVTVALAVGAFFVVFGALAMGPEVLARWIDSTGDVLFDFTLFGEPVAVTAELLRVSGGLAGFLGLYFTISVVTDSTYREEFLEEVSAEARATFGARAEYLRLRALAGLG